MFDDFLISQYVITINMVMIILVQSVEKTGQNKLLVESIRGCSGFLLLGSQRRGYLSDVLHVLSLWTCTFVLIAIMVLSTKR